MDAPDIITASRTPAAETPVTGTTVTPWETAGSAPTFAATPDVSPEATETPVPEPLTVAIQELKYENEYIEVNILYPEISGMLDTALQEEINSDIRVKLEQRVDSMEERARSEEDAGFSYYIDAGFAVLRNDGTYLSVRESISYYGGGASSDFDSIFINIRNSLPGQRLALEGLFLPGTDYKSVINLKLKDMITADPYGSDYSFSPVTDGQWFYLKESELVIVYPRYDIAPGMDGEPEFAIPLFELGDILIPELCGSGGG